MQALELSPNGQLMVWGDDEISVRDKDGKTLWTKPTEAWYPAGTCVSACGAWMAICADEGALVQHVRLCCTWSYKNAALLGAIPLEI